MELLYKVNEKPGFFKNLLFALQQVLAILAATIAVPAIIGNGMSQSAALFGAGVGTLVYLLFTKFKSPVFLGSSFAFLSSMSAAFAGAASASIGYFGIIIGAAMAGLVYVIFAIIVKIVGTNWVNKVLPPVVIGPIVAIIGLSLAGNAVSDITAASGGVMSLYVGVRLICGLVTLLTVVLCSVYGKKWGKMFPFIIGIVAGYAVALGLTFLGQHLNNDTLLIIDLSKFNNITWVPDFTFKNGFDGLKELINNGGLGQYLAVIAMAYVPVSVVVFAEHLADHKNLSSIINQDLLQEPGLHRTLLGDGIGSAVGAFFGGCPNTTYSLCVFM